MQNSRSKAWQAAAEFPPCPCLTEASSSCFLFSQNPTLIAELFAATSAARHGCVKCKINKGWERNPQQSAEDLFPSRKEGFLIPLQLCSGFLSQYEKILIPLQLCSGFFPSRKNPLPSASLTSLMPLRSRGTLWFVGLILCTSVLAQLWRRAEKKKLFLTVRVAQISYPGLVLGQFCKAEVWNKVDFPAD